MLKILILFALLIPFYNTTFATNACERFVPETVSFEAEIIKNANLRDFPCIGSSTVLWTSKLWDTYTVTRQVHGYYEIQDNYGNTYWIWDQAVKKKQWYVLTGNDVQIVDLFINKLEKLVNKKWYYIKVNFAEKLDKVLNKYALSPRVKAVLLEVHSRLDDIEDPSEGLKQDQEGQDEQTQGSSDQSNALYQELQAYNINFSEVRDYWLWLYDQVRMQEKLYWYSYNYKLEETAFQWSKTQKDVWEASHKRNENSSFYDYGEITSWFQERWVVCESIWGYTHTENVWWWKFYCSDEECSDELKAWIKRTFDYYMSEKNLDYQPHYSSIVNGYFKNVWLWVSVNKLWENDYEFYLTIHYCTELQ